MFASLGESSDWTAGWTTKVRCSIPCTDNKTRFFSKNLETYSGSLSVRFLFSGYGGQCSGEASGRGGKAASHIHRLPRLRSNGALPPLLHTPSRCSQGQLHLRLVHIREPLSPYQTNTDEYTHILLITNLLTLYTYIQNVSTSKRSSSGNIIDTF